MKARLDYIRTIEGHRAKYIRVGFNNDRHHEIMVSFPFEVEDLCKALDELSARLLKDEYLQIK